MAKRILHLIATAGLILYPVVVYFGLRNESLRWASLLVVVLIAPAIFVRLREADGQDLKTLALLPVMTAAFIGVGGALRSRGLVLATPTVINATLLIGFGTTLLSDRPMIERFARLVEPELSNEKVRWCRTWTGIWCVFFVLNGTIAAILALRGPLTWWTFYNSVLAYALIGAMFATERILRWWRFERSTNTV